MKAVCLLSGGMDSAVAATMISQEGYKLYCIHFNYGQTPLLREKKCSRELANWLDAEEYHEIDLNWLKEIGGSALTNPNEKLTLKNKNKEYVPFRNTIFLSMATAYAESIGAKVIIIGSNAGDRICPDNKKSYLDAFQKVIEEGSLSGKEIKIRAPLVEKGYGKKELVGKGLKLKVPFEKTWSCHNNTKKACGKCNNCKVRYMAFQENNSEDPIGYETKPKI